MPRINLLPIKAARRQVTARNEMFAMIALIVATIGGLFLWYESVDSEVSAVQGKMRAVEQDIGRLTEEVKKVEELQAKEKTVKQKLGVIKQLVANKTGPAMMLDELATIMTTEAKRVWLTALKQDGNTILLEGGAMDHEDISEFQLALQRRGTFTAIKLKDVTTKPQSKEEAGYLTWKIACTIGAKS